MEWISGSLGGLITPIIGVALLVFFLKQRKAQEYDVPPLDRVDARKLDGMVSNQIEEALRPILQSEAYPQEQINEILTRTSVGSPTFRR